MMASIGMAMHESYSCANFFRPRTPLQRVMCGACGTAVKATRFKLGPDGTPMCVTCLDHLVLGAWSPPSPRTRTRRRRKARRADRSAEL
jgi:hypothetical protein